MHTTPSSAARQRVLGHTLRSARHIACIALPLVALVACSDQGLLEPRPTSTVAALLPTDMAHASVVVTPDFSTFDTRAEFNAVGVIDHLDGFEGFSGSPVYLQPTPWTSESVTYTSGVNAILAPGSLPGIVSNSISAEFGSPITGEFAATDAFTLFGADFTMIVSKAPVDVVVYTNQGNYAFNDLDIPLSTDGRRFFGVALSRPGEYLTGFRVSPHGPSSTPLLDDVAVGHVGTGEVAPAEAGWVTGGGWIASPAGANVTAPTAAGKLTFGFVVRNETAASAPSGHAEFKLASGKLDFRSTALESLILTGNTAHCQGRGTVNGVGGYGFSITVIDDPSDDAIRLRVWSLDTGGAVYDNQSSEPPASNAASALGGGSIQVHAR